MMKGLKCAAGCLIADDEYESKIEGMTWHVLTLKGLAPLKHKPLIEAMQNIHDDRLADAWELEFKKVADRFDLEYKGV